MKRIICALLCILMLCTSLMLSCDCKDKDENDSEITEKTPYEQNIGKSTNFRCQINVGSVDSFYLHGDDAIYLYNLLLDQWEDGEKSTGGQRPSIKLSFMSDFESKKDAVVYNNMLWYGEFAVNTDNNTIYSANPNESKKEARKLSDNMYSTIANYAMQFNLRYNDIGSKDENASYNNGEIRLSVLAVANAIGAEIQWKTDKIAVIKASGNAYELDIENKILSVEGTTKNLLSSAFAGVNYFCEATENDVVVDSDTMEFFFMHMKRSIEITAKLQNNSSIIMLTEK